MIQNLTPETRVPDAWTWIASPPGGPAGPFWSVVRGDGRIIALQVPDEATALMLVGMKMGLENAYAILHGQGDVTNARAIELALGHLVEALGRPRMKTPLPLSERPKTRPLYDHRGKVVEQRLDDDEPKLAPSTARADTWGADTPEQVRADQHQHWDPGHYHEFYLRAMTAWDADRRRLETLERAEEVLTLQLQVALSDCPPRPDPRDVPLDGIPGHHDFSCPFRAAMQPVLAVLAAGEET